MISPLDDTLGVGSTQATNNPADAGKDEAFWSSLNGNVKNLHAVISGHGEPRQLRVSSLVETLL